MSEASFAADAKTVNAVERCLERIISGTDREAARKLGPMAEEMCPEIDWPALRAVGNILRHEYERVEVTRIWLMVEDDLPPLEAAVSGALSRLKDWAFCSLAGSRLSAAMCSPRQDRDDFRRSEHDLRG